MQIKILNRWTSDVLWQGDAADIGDAAQKAVVAGADLTGADLTGARLTDADLTGADLAGAKLTGADLTGAKLTGANLTDADLTDADLADANLAGAKLTRAKLTDAKLTGADLTRANLADLGFEIPVVPDLDRLVAEAVGARGERLDMQRWHNGCGTTHCRAGWAITLAGEAGKVLEQRVGPSVAGALIYFASTGRPPPNFFADDADALADIKRCAAEASA